MTQDFKNWVMKVKLAMVENGLTQSKLAKLIKVTPPVISDLFNYGKGSEELKKKINVVLGLK